MLCCWEAEMQFVATIASIYTMVVSAAAAEAADLSCKVTETEGTFRCRLVQAILAAKLKIESNTYK